MPLILSLTIFYTNHLIPESPFLCLELNFLVNILFCAVHTFPYFCQRPGPPPPTLLLLHSFWGFRAGIHIVKLQSFWSFNYNRKDHMISGHHLPTKSICPKLFIIVMRTEMHDRQDWLYLKVKQDHCKAESDFVQIPWQVQHWPPSACNKYFKHSNAELYCEHCTQKALF
jgi:hypothetical protein